MKQYKDDDWMQIYNGVGKDKVLHPLEPRPEDFHSIEMVAHALALKTRFNGHCQFFYSVAQHSVLVSKACSSENALWGLLHELDEVFLPDIPKPIKIQLPQWKDIAKKHMIAGAKTFGLILPIPEEVKYYDLACLHAEKDDVMGECDKEWFELPPRIETKIKPMTWFEAEQAFVDRYYELAGTNSIKDIAYENEITEKIKLAFSTMKVQNSVRFLDAQVKKINLIFKKVSLITQISNNVFKIQYRNVGSKLQYLEFVCKLNIR